eukprot:252890-Pyramimonas_sp.AAC.1
MAAARAPTHPHVWKACETYARPECQPQPHRIGPRPEYIPSCLTRLVPALSIYPLASPDWWPGSCACE